MRYEVEIVYAQRNSYFVDAESPEDAYEEAKELWVLDEDPAEVVYSDIKDYDVREVQS
jgi:hypothetical protein